MIGVHGIEEGGFRRWAFGGVRYFFKSGLFHVELHDSALEDREEVLSGPIEREGGSEVVGDEEEEDRHDGEHDLLALIHSCRLRCQLHLKDHRHAHDEGQGIQIKVISHDGETEGEIEGVDGVCDRKILHP